MTIGFFEVQFLVRIFLSHHAEKNATKLKKKCVYSFSLSSELAVLLAHNQLSLLHYDNVEIIQTFVRPRIGKESKFSKIGQPWTII